MLPIINIELRGEIMLGVRLKYLRKSKNKTQQDIADVLGITRPAYTAYEQGKRNPDYGILEKIADYYNVSVDYLLGRTHEKMYSYEEVIQHKLMNFRQDKKLTNADMASKLGISRDQYSKIEYEGKIPKELLEPITDILNISIEDLESHFTYYEIRERQKDEAEFQAFANDPSLQKWYKELPKSREEDLQKLRKIWEMINSEEKK
ncbi:XRE family transcriptional regulator [Lysinibacillus fusiformis]|nr:XRE family transcriptional regulator [Lysinibacillus fusiformis]